MVICYKNVLKIAKVNLYYVILLIIKYKL